MTRKQWKMGASLAAAVLLIVFIAQNTGVVSYRFLMWDITMSRIFFLPLILLAGFGLGFWTARKR